ncbi:MAG: hypothetical protein ACREJ5_17110 [Geminicoccaceae bacterium]
MLRGAASPGHVISRLSGGGHRCSCGALLAPDESGRLLAPGFSVVRRRAEHAPVERKLRAPMFADTIDDDETEAAAAAYLSGVGERLAIERGGEIPAKTWAAPGWIMDLADRIASGLEVYAPAIKMFRPARSRERHDLVLPDCSGCYRHFFRDIFIRDDLPRHEQVVTLGHEIFHHYCGRRGIQGSEHAAEAFGRHVAAWAAP